MIKRYFCIVSAILLLSISAVEAQQKTLTVDMLGKAFVRPERHQPISWINNNGDYSWSFNDNVLKANVKLKDKTETIVSLSDLNKALTSAGKQTIISLPSIKWHNEYQFIFSNSKDYLIYDIKSKTVKAVNTVPDDVENIEMEYSSFNQAYTKENNLYVLSNGVESKVTDDKNKDIVNGQNVHRNEWGIEKGSFWSPKGDKLAFYRMDQSMVTDYPIIHIEPVKNRLAEAEMIKYPMAGMASHHVTVGVYDLKLKRTIFINTGEPKEQFLTSVTWSPDQKYIYITILNRAQNHSWVNKYNADNGEFVKTLFEEQNDKWVEPEHGLFFADDNPTKFLWLSKRDGYNNLYLYDSDGKLLKQITKSKFDITNFIGYSSKGDKAYYMAAYPLPIDNQGFEVNLNTCVSSCLTKEKGWHTMTPNANGTYFIDEYSNPAVPYRCQIVDANANVKKEVKNSPNPLKDYALGQTSLLTLKATDGSDLYCRLIKPLNFDSTKKYPVFYYVYGGPHMQLVKDSWLYSQDMFLQYMATKGYVVFTLDNHGTPNRGLAFEQSIHRNVGTLELDDQMKGVEYLKKQAYVDTTRMGINGWSYGGFMTISMMLKHPDVFKAAVAGGPVIDWKYYEIMYGERYMDTPLENPQGYNNSSLLNYIDNLKGRLMVIHGTVDPTVVWQHSLMFVKECVDKGKLLDYFVYPEHEHNVRGIDRIHLYRKIEDYMNQYLK